MPNNQDKIERLVLQILPEDRTPTEEELNQHVLQFSKIFPASDKEIQEIVRNLHARLAIRMDRGTAIVEDNYAPWLNARKPDIEPFYWNRYEVFLSREGWTPTVTRALERVTDEILDLAGDPEKDGGWKRRGLVMGDVQSGKTATYTGLCCKAADVGYRLIVLLTGTLENLRRQTQERLDEGFIGLDSSGFLSTERQRREIGVGLVDPRRCGVVFTSLKKDFNTDLVNQLNFRLGTFREPILLVVKKNKRILENLERWLREFNAAADGKIDTPLLLIDDEADNASVNTSKAESKPTAINEGIRGLLKLFRRSSYVGFTATPFANIFIDADSTDAMLGDDLFPRDFIYALEPPTNYVGAEYIFNSPAGKEIIEDISDAEASFSEGHNSSFIVTQLPQSLLEAINCFVLANGIRDLRGEGPTHRSMLVNVTRFTNVQHQVASLVDEYLHTIQRDIQNFSRLAESSALKSPQLKYLRSVFELHYANCGFKWSQIQKSLISAALPIKVQEVNQSTGASALDYKKFEDTGLRVIAVGGNSLSRGLTLYGLCISYFFRNSQMYDTLLQMGRWFGYRDRYTDLCKLWLTKSAVHWYSHISEATSELRQEIRRMRQLGLTPKDFGLKVREHPESLIVTARNKMRSAKQIERNISLSAQGLETPRLFWNDRTIRENATVVRTMFKKLRDDGYSYKSSPYNNCIWEGVPSKYVSELLRVFQVHPLNMTFQGEAIADFLDRGTVDALKNWDIVIPNGSEPEEDFATGIRSRPQRRSVTTPNSNEILVSGSSARVGSRGIEREGIPEPLSRDTANKYLQDNPEKSSAPDRIYREIRSRPLMLIHIVRPYDGEDDVPMTMGDQPVLALGLSFPKFEDSASVKKASYRVNTVEWNNRFNFEIGDDEDGEDDAD